MTRSHLEHILRAAAAITGRQEFIVIGSQSILGACGDAPPGLLQSMEADIFCPDDAEATDLIDGSIGELSPFHATFRYYAHGVGPDTAVLPRGWESRLVPLTGPNTHGATGLCLEPNDLAVSKLAAGREKDLRFLAILFAHRLADPEVVAERLHASLLSEETLSLCQHRLRRLA